MAASVGPRRTYDVIHCHFGPNGNYSDGHAAPVWLDVSLKNKTGKPLSFSYDVPTDILSLHVNVSEGRDKRFLPPRAGVRWFSTPGAKPKNEVVLKPGGGFEEITVWMSVKLPGVHKTAELFGGGAGLNPR